MSNFGTQLHLQLKKRISLKLEHICAPIAPQYIYLQSVIPLCCYSSTSKATEAYICD